MNKVRARILFPTLIVAVGIAFMLALSPTAAGSADSAAPTASELASIKPQGKQPAIPHQPATPTPTPEAVSVPGSTDGIVVMSYAIVAIIVIPILLQRRLWMK